ncbi:unnamed protein product [Ceratitis capitata]|uniref:(Mediterranean fruit fly) hypothetical protein n=1 Tax=Ceratitis capitata TaxID=7213 RepID=A0A811UE86_CERCA|nr:unnamed protein product [Ceratitis capitata]
MLKELHSMNSKDKKALVAKYQLSVSSLSGLVMLPLIIIAFKIILQRRIKSFPVTTVIDKNEKISDETSRKQEGITNTSKINLIPLTSVHLSEDTELFKGERIC